MRIFKAVLTSAVTPGMRVGVAVRYGGEKLAINKQSTEPTCVCVCVQVSLVLDVLFQT